MDSVVKPWLIENFELPEDFAINTKYKRLMRMAALAAERAKIELSAKDTATINLSEAETGCLDENGDEIYLDCDLTRDTFNQLIADRVEQSIQAARDALEKAGLSPFDLERIVFVGGPTNYKPIRDKVCQELGVEGSTEVNPMTAVAEGASLFAESIDWSSKDNSRKTSRGRLEAGGELNLTLNYIARTPSATAKVMVQSKDEIPAGYEFQIDSTDTGWTSGRIQLTAGASVTLTLPKPGLNLFRVSAFDASGSPVKLLQNSIIITRTAATVDAIPASYSIAVEVLDRLGGEPALDYLIRAGEPLPKKGKKIFKAAQTLKAGSDETLNIKLWEGEIENPITDNRPIGVLKISGTDFSSGVIPAGADLECAYEIEDSGNINLEVSVPSIGGVFNSGRNFYSRQEGAINYTDAAELVSSNLNSRFTYT
jgi:molecular chaperone DnaK